MAVVVVSFIGRANSGKTLLLERVVAEVKRRGYRVAVVKHCPHGCSVDQPGSDTWRYQRAGSDVVAASAPHELAVMRRLDAEPTADQIAEMVGSDVDIVLLEGFKQSDLPKILVNDQQSGRQPVGYGGELLASVTPIVSPEGVMRYGESQVDRIAQLLLGRIGATVTKSISNAAQISTPATPDPMDLDALLEQSTAYHGHLCPGQVLGVRLAMRGCRELGIERPREEKKRMVVYVEIDRCAADAIGVVTGCQLGKRTLKYLDYGKLAATFVDLKTGRAVRLAARAEARQQAGRYHREGMSPADTQVVAYQEMTDDELFAITPVNLTVPEMDLPGPPRRRVICDACGEEVNDGREVTRKHRALCQSCAGGAYYAPGDAGRTAHTEFQVIK
jgi:formylmethanofuran dehydrogenase subunit E